MKWLEKYEKAIEINPDDTEIILEYAKALSKYNKDTEAIAAYSKVLSLDANNTEAQELLADTYVKTDETDKAILEYNKTLELLPDNEAAMIKADSEDVVYKIKSLFNSQL